VVDVPSSSNRGSFAAVVARLMSVNVVLLLSGLLTGPIIAHVLGAEGRGELAAITAVLTLGPAVLDLGTSNWIARERATGRERGEILGAVLPTLAIASAVAVASALPLAEALGQERDDVETFVRVALLAMPATIVLQALLAFAIGESRWTLYARAQIAGIVLPAGAVVLLWLLGELSVARAAIAYVAGPVVAKLALLAFLRGIGPLRLEARRTREALSFSLRSWLGTVTALANNRLDQLLMAALVPSRELGHYAVAVTISAIAFGLGAAVSGAIYPRVAAGDGALAARACRIAVLLASVAALLLMVATPWLVPFAFGEEFRDAVAMTEVLLLSSVPATGTLVLTAALTASGDPGSPMRAELATLAVTVPALVLLLPGHGGDAAAAISLGAYLLRTTLQLRAVERTFTRPWRSFVLVERDDLRWLARAARRRARA